MSANHADTKHLLWFAERPLTSVQLEEWNADDADLADGRGLMLGTCVDFPLELRRRAKVQEESNFVVGCSEVIQ